MLDDNVLTIGFARRFTGYKRPTLLLHDRKRLTRILMNPKRPVQLLVAGKAHPLDLEGVRWCVNGRPIRVVPRPVAAQCFSRITTWRWPPNWSRVLICGSIRHAVRGKHAEPAG